MSPSRTTGILTVAAAPASFGSLTLNFVSIKRMMGSEAQEANQKERRCRVIDATLVISADRTQTGMGSSLLFYLLSAVSLIFTRVSFSAPTEPPNCDSLLGFPRTKRSSSPSSYRVSSTSDRIHGFSASPAAQRHTAMTGRVRKFEAALKMKSIQQSFPIFFQFCLYLVSSFATHEVLDDG